VQRTEPSRIANRTRDWFKVFNRLGRRQQTIGELRLFSDSSSSPQEINGVPTPGVLRSDTPLGIQGCFWPHGGQINSEAVASCSHLNELSPLGR
jgi:hypothetical protein